MKVDFHIHTKYSPDSFTKLSLLKKICAKKELFPLITDHNTIKGALEFRKHYGDCIVGEEIKATEGEVIGLFLNEEIPRGLSAIETVEKIREQGGVVYLPHPFDSVRSSWEKMDFRPDIIEVFNSRVIFQKHNKMAEEFADKHNYLKAAASDAHFARHIGLSYAEMDDFCGKQGMLRSLRNAVLVKNRTPLYILAATSAIGKIKRIF